MAHKGYAFIHGEEAPECQSCRLKNTCVKNLIQGRRYRVVEVRKVLHLCPICGEVNLVDVEESDIPLLVESSKAFEGITVTFRMMCNLCRDNEKCHPAGLREGDRLLITKIMEKKTCLRGPMTEVLVRRI